MKSIGEEWREKRGEGEGEPSIERADGRNGCRCVLVPTTNHSEPKASVRRTTN
jgi:hypothetical protein